MRVNERLMGVLALAAVGTCQFYSGEGTTYGPPDGGDSAFTGNCALMKPLDLAPRFHAALNNFQWSTGIHCGRCVEVQCVDPRCTSQEKVLGQITDRCPECQFGDLDMSLPMFNKATGLNTDRPKIKWQFVNCPVSGGVQVCAKSGSSKYWLYIQASNALNGVAKMKINGGDAPSFDASYYFKSQVLNVELSDTMVDMTSHSGETISTKVSLQADQCTQIPQQFTVGVVPGPPVPPPSPSPSPSPSPNPSTSPPPSPSPSPSTSAPTTEAPKTTTPAPTTSGTPSPTTGAPTTGTPEPTTVALTTVVATTTVTPTTELPLETLPAANSSTPVATSAPVVARKTDAVEVVVQSSAGAGANVTNYLVAGASFLVVVAAVVLVVVVKRSRRKYMQEKESDASFDGPIMRYGHSETSQANVAIL
ncbi:hypothetical protein SDRG_01832 [Saprolegnia diclina VS20]|uniref:Expansin-like EG45 domain-containing protein n=1 Tax=Saprolegnia diclina (strain VS20) TaxID=1156394 RepID=T0R1C5_SAPDV|nr:hypothetical protein SDRG_01832 [Saprolegnia diclina VS20]EQC40761.1 hypothetical protein SDRG_01832 [Saprolegnia diclina VS20]|eukprot:XP_008605605.1 hypothetical protein SDRG_01832 [Saprolegnia diclina VS20]